MTDFVDVIEAQGELVRAVDILPRDPSQYGLAVGDTLTVTFNAARLRLFGDEELTGDEGLLDQQLGAIGIYCLGIYTVESADDARVEQSAGRDSLPIGQYAVGAFRYHKRGLDGHLEDDERVVIISGIGTGVHPDHAGQDPTFYIVGPQIGTMDGVGSKPKLIKDGTEAPSKNFSGDCIRDGVRGQEPVLANGQTKR